MSTRKIFALLAALVLPVISVSPARTPAARNDRMINPNLQRALARKMGARTTILDSSHVAMLAKPAEVAAVIRAAAASGAGP